MKKETILVVGASGNVGGEVARLLKGQGYQVVTTTGQKASAPGQVHLNLLTGEGLGEAFEGIDRAFFLSPAGYANQYQILNPLVQEAKRRGLSKVVLMSALGANGSDQAPLRQAEIELEKSGLNYNIIRPNWFMQNFHSFWIEGIRQHGKIFLPAGNAKTSFIDTHDIAAVAAKLLVDDQYSRRDFDLTGPEALTHAEVAQKISEATGRAVSYEEISPEAFRNQLLQAGLPVDYTDFLVLIMGFLKEGYNAGVNQNVKMITGSESSDFASYAKANKALFV